MKVRKIWSTPGGQELITYIARVSNPQNQEEQTDESVAKLLAFLLREKHVSPFEMVNFCVEVETTRAISAQIIRHRSFSFQEFSARYQEVTALEQKIPEVRYKGTTNRQSSLEYKDSGISEKNNRIANSLIDRAIKFSYLVYNKLLDLGVANETARMILPMSSPTRIYINGSLRSWIHYFESRCSKHTQKEHRDVAFSIRDLIKVEYPLIFPDDDKF